MRDMYNKLIQEKGISDILHYVETISYTRKLSILDELLKTYEVSILNQALEEYYKEYILLKRVDIINLFFNKLKLCLTSGADNGCV